MTAATDLIMENYLKSPYTKRYIIEDSIPKVTSDGQPHEMMTLVAGLSGIFAAVVILGILVSLIGCKHKERQSNSDEAPPSPSVSEIPEMKGKRSSILPLFSKSTSLEESSPRLVSVSVISNNFPYVPNEIALGAKSDKNTISFGNIHRF